MTAEELAKALRAIHVKTNWYQKLNYWESERWVGCAECGPDRGKSVWPCRTLAILDALLPEETDA